MSNKITENEIELFAIELLEGLGFEYIYAPEYERSFEDVILKEKLTSSLTSINPSLHVEQIQYAVKQIERLKTTELLTDNETFHKMLTEGITVEVLRDGVTRGEIVKLIDFDDISNNDFVVSNQFTVIENGINKRPDLILFINGLPLVVVELKNPVDENATIGSAYKQIQTYKSVIPSLFTYNAFCIISDGLEAKAGTISAGLSRFMSWKLNGNDALASSNGETKVSLPMEVMINGMLNPVTLLDLIRNFIVYEKSTKEEKVNDEVREAALGYSKTGITTIETVKKLAAYHQYYAVNKAVERTTIASAEDGDKKGGVVWHTQGSGKSLSMVFYTGKIVLSLNNPTILVITDRNDLDDQL
ncbi:MAG: type I restriction endonuclease, partial [Campylobacterota bacterium]|nr:type I restriction endonuclease [Campylobacterota bacterium]